MYPLYGCDVLFVLSVLDASMNELREPDSGRGDMVKIVLQPRRGNCAREA